MDAVNIKKRAFTIEEESIDNIRPRTGYLAVKRVLDFVLSIIGLIVLSPVFLVISIAIKLEDGEPVIFTQKRIGRDEKEFNMYKFRTMKKDSEKIHQQLAREYGNVEVSFKIKNDPRITRVGGFLRKTSLDELPQLINIIKGEMSIVGPRPLPDYEYMEEKERYGNIYSKRYTVEQGLTCFWQINGRENNVSFEERMAQDVEYANKVSFFTDLIIVIKTFAVVISGKGAC